jgi:hypothetical protein
MTVLVIAVIVITYNKEKVGKTDNPTAQKAALTLLAASQLRGGRRRLATLALSLESPGPTKSMASNSGVTAATPAMTSGGAICRTSGARRVTCLLARCAINVARRVCRRELAQADPRFGDRKSLRCTDKWFARLKVSAHAFKAIWRATIIRRMVGVEKPAACAAPLDVHNPDYNCSKRFGRRQTRSKATSRLVCKTRRTQGRLLPGHDFLLPCNTLLAVTFQIRTPIRSAPGG